MVIQLYSRGAWMCFVINKLVENTPMDNKSTVEAYWNEKVSVLKPNYYISGVSSVIDDYVFSFPTSTPPPTIIGKKEYQFSKGRMVIFPPDISISTKESAPTYEYTILVVNRDFMHEIAREAGGIKKISFNFLDNPCNKSTLGTISKLTYEHKEHNGSCTLMIESINTQLVIELLRDSGVINDNSKSFGKKEHYVEKAIEFMHAYYNANIKIDDICRSINLSSFYFIRLFKECTGQTPHDYLTDLRIRYATEFIRSGSTSISEIARQCGFINASHFSTCFKRITGMFPLEYKRFMQF
jgi:AraC-like DNA-binding protein